MATRIYIKEQLIIHHEVNLSQERANYALKVLRLKQGDALKLFNGDGYDYSGSITTIKKNELTILLQEKTLVDTESKLNITLAQVIPKGSRMDFILQKSTELGVNCIQPLISTRSVVKLDDNRKLARLQHWQKIIYSACEQSHRAVITEIFLPLTLTQWLDQIMVKNVTNTRWVLSPEGSMRFSTQIKPQNNIELLVGSEGGFTTEELKIIQEYGFQEISLGPRVLRAETAPLAGLAVIQAIWGDG